MLDHELIDRLRSGDCCNENNDDAANHIEALGERIEGLELDRGRRDAKIAVLTSVLAKLAREGQQEYAQMMLERSDIAWMNVKPEDLVVAHVNKTILENEDGSI